MENQKLKNKKMGRPKLNIDNNTLQREIQKYLNKTQSGTVTYKNLGIGKTSFYKILKQLEVKR